MRAKIKYNIVYITINLCNGKKYVGEHSTYKIEDGYLGSGNLFYLSLKKYGRENFKRKILEYCNTKEEAHKSQTKYIKEYNTLYPNGYNLDPNGGIFRGEKLSKLTCKKMSESRIGKNNGMFNKHHTKLSCEKIKKTRKERNCGKGHNNARFDNTVYKFYNTQTKEIYEGYKYDLAQIINSRGSSLNAVINGSRKHHKNWIVI